MESTFLAEPIDAAWEAEANAKISDGLTRLENISAPVVECASTMCRIHATTTGDELSSDAMSLLNAFAEELGWRGQAHVMVNHESGRMTAYLARPGNTLPQPPRQN
jgi:hypothetical protein